MKLLKYILFSVLIFPVSALAIGVAVRPARLDIQGISNSAARREILVSNPSKDVAIFDVYPDNFNSLIDIMPASFVLESGDQKKIYLSVKPGKSGRFATNISVVARPLSESAFNAASGVKIPLLFEALPQKEENLALAISNLSLGGRTGIVFGYIILTGIFILFFRYALTKLRKSS